MEKEVIDVQSHEVKTPEIHLDDIEVYKSIVGGLKVKLVGLIEEGILTEKVASQIIEDYMLQAFKQVVQVNYR